MEPITNKPGFGVLFRVREKTNPKGPDFTGGVNLDNREYEIAGWERTSARGMPYLSLSLKAARDRPVADAPDELDRVLGPRPATDPKR